MSLRRHLALNFSIPVRTFAAKLAPTFVLIFSVALVGLSCDSDAGDTPRLNANEAAEVKTILTTGAEHPDDPYVRAETFRVLELLGDARLSDLAEKGVSDDDPMVRVVALRALLASEHPRGRSIALDAFRRREGAERAAILSAALEYGSPPLKREIVGRALRTRDAQLRYMAFTTGLLARIENAVEAEDDENLQRHLLPELGTYVSIEDPVLAALALRTFVELGDEERSRPLIEKFEDRRTPLEERIVLGGILARAHVPGARPAFERIVNAWEESMRDDRLGLPQEVVPPPLLRIALLGTVATGDTTHVARVQKYTKNVSNAEMLEVLDALSTNPSEDAAVALKIAMQDARNDVRSFAVEHYKDRDDASPKALYDVLPAAPYTTQRQVAVVLWSEFPDAWIDLNESALQRSSEVDEALRLLRNVVTSPAEVTHIAPLKPILEKVSEDPNAERANLARYLLRLINESEDADAAGGVSLDALDRETTYAYLEFLVRSEAQTADIYRKYFYSDSFALRLMSAAGLWRVTGGTTADAKGPADEGPLSPGEPEPESVEE